MSSPNFQTKARVNCDQINKCWKNSRTNACPSRTNSGTTITKWGEPARIAKRVSELLRAVMPEQLTEGFRC
eukprot:8681065-Heterocapsa_arctica.AAC.1